MKASILLLTIIGMLAISIVTGSVIEDVQPENTIASAISDFNIVSRQKRANYCCWKLHVDYVREHKGDTQNKNKAKAVIPSIYQHYRQEPGLVNGRPHWTSLDKEKAIWYISSKNHWMIGKASQRSQNLAYAYASGTGRTCPMAGYTWKYIDDGRWKDADESLAIWCNDSTSTP